MSFKVLRMQKGGSLTALGRGPESAISEHQFPGSRRRPQVRDNGSNHAEHPWREGPSEPEKDSPQHRLEPSGHETPDREQPQNNAFWS